MKKKQGKLSVAAFGLSRDDRLILSSFIANNRDWVARYAFPLETLLRQSLRRQWIELIRVQQIEPHPVYDVFLRLGRSSPATASGVGFAVRQAFTLAGRMVKANHCHAVVRGDRAKARVFVDDSSMQRSKTHAGFRQNRRRRY